MDATNQPALPAENTAEIQRRGRPFSVKLGGLFIFSYPSGGSTAA